VGLQPAQPLGQALDADRARIGVGQQLGDQAPALAAAAAALVGGYGHKQRGKREEQGDGTAEHQSAAQPRRKPFPAIGDRHRCPLRSESRPPFSRPESRG
jgi:hypothetical protein